jgi:hypothetical protein
MSNTISITEAFERFFSDRFKNYDTFFGSFFRGRGKNDLLPLDRTSRPYQIKVSDIQNFFDKEQEISIKKSIWAEILDDLSYDKKVTSLAKILGYHPVSLGEAISKGVVSDRLLESLEKNLAVIEKDFKILYIEYEEKRKDEV